MANGKIGERLFQQIMEGRNYKVEDVSMNPDYWYKDIDFFVTSSTSGERKSFEVKWDSCISRTGNLYLELTNVHSKGGKGWYKFCEADYLAYGDAKNRIFYIIPLLELKKKVEQLPSRYAKCGYDSTGLLVSLKDIKDIIQIL